MNLSLSRPALPAEKGKFSVLDGDDDNDEEEVDVQDEEVAWAAADVTAVAAAVMARIKCEYIRGAVDMTL